jgi:hypothetical protein
MGEVAFGRPSLIADSYRRPTTADQNLSKGGIVTARSVEDSRCWGLEMFTFPVLQWGTAYPPRAKLWVPVIPRFSRSEGTPHVSPRDHQQLPHSEPARTDQN